MLRRGNRRERDGSAGEARGGRREIARWIFAADGEFHVFFFPPPSRPPCFSVYLRVVPFFVYRARTVDFSYESKAITCVSSRFWDSALFALHKALIRWCETAGISDSFRDSLLDRRQRFARRRFTASVYPRGYTGRRAESSKENRITGRDVPPSNSRNSRALCMTERLISRLARLDEDLSRECITARLDSAHSD